MDGKTPHIDFIAEHQFWPCQKKINFDRLGLSENWHRSGANIEGWNRSAQVIYLYSLIFKIPQKNIYEKIVVFNHEITETFSFKITATNIPQLVSIFSF